MSAMPAFCGYRNEMIGGTPPMKSATFRQRSSDHLKEYIYICAQRGVQIVTDGTSSRACRGDVCLALCCLHPRFRKPRLRMILLLGLHWRQLWIRSSTIPKHAKARAGKSTASLPRELVAKPSCASGRAAGEAPV